MRSFLFAASLALLAFGCSSADDENNPNSTPQQDAAPEAASGEDAAIGQDASVQPDSGLPACPEEIKLSGSELIPCDCYGHEANETTLADPNVDGIYPGSPVCMTQVVCCPTIQNLRCEDHEYVDDAGNIIDGATPADAASDALIPTCQFEVDLSTGTLPCDCKGTIVPDPPSELLPTCDKKIVCCPSQGVICE
jgi:hypothetical protein